jgi:hypothetical protein
MLSPGDSRIPFIHLAVRCAKSRNFLLYKAHSKTSVEPGKKNMPEVLKAPGVFRHFFALYAPFFSATAISGTFCSICSQNSSWRMPFPSAMLWEND